MRVIIIFLIILNISYADITGKVFRDLPMNGNTLGTYGIKDDVEPGVANITVKGTDENGDEATSTTDSNGDYVLSGLSGKVRVEFSGWSTYLKESVDAKVQNTSVRFVNDGDSDINFALHNPNDYSSTDNPKLITSLFLNGKASANVGNNAGIISWDYNNFDKESYDILKEKQEVGTIWGLAYSKEDKSLYASAILRRHAGIPDKDKDGKGDLGVIYKIDASGTVSEFYRFSDSEVGTIADDSGRGLLDDGGPSADSDAFAKIGNVGLGDLDISEDNKRVYVTSLYSKKLVTTHLFTKSNNMI